MRHQCGMKSCRIGNSLRFWSAGSRSRLGLFCSNIMPHYVPRTCLARFLTMVSPMHTTNEFPHRPGRRLLRLPKVSALVALRRSATYDKISRGEFPAAVHLGPRTVAWPSNEIDGGSTCASRRADAARPNGSITLQRPKSADCWRQPAPTSILKFSRLCSSLFIQRCVRAKF
jgi:predicted DNA-binding transcriptional regulator AlpA